MPNLCNLCYSQDSTYKEPRTPTDHQDRVPHAGSLSRQHPGPQPESEAGNSYVLVAGDHLTKWMEAYAIPIKRPSRLPDEMFCRYSPPEQLHSDQGRQFESDFIKHICKSSICKRLGSLHTILNVMALWKDSIVHCYTCWPQQPENIPSFDWEDQIRKVSMAYNMCAGIHWLHTFLCDVWMTG